MALNDIMNATSGSKFTLDALKHGFRHFGAGITLTDNEIKDIIKVIKSLKNKEFSYEKLLFVNY